MLRKNFFTKLSDQVDNEACDSNGASIPQIREMYLAAFVHVFNIFFKADFLVWSGLDLADPLVAHIDSLLLRVHRYRA